MTPLSYDGMNLFWNDEFDGFFVNQGDWNYEIGNGCPNLCGWGNNELQYYKAENSQVSNGALTIEARAENVQSNQYTSTRMTTQGKVAFKYGRVDVRAQLPTGKGLWPAIWMLGTNITSVGWPTCGELDITGSDKEAFHKPFFMILNVAVGGNWPGNPNAETEFPTSMKVDYVRVFQNK